MPVPYKGQMTMIYKGLLLEYIGAILLHLAQCMPICNNLDTLKWIFTWLEHIYMGTAKKGKGTDLDFGPFIPLDSQFYPYKQCFPQPFKIYL